MKILLLTAHFGDGHRQVASALRAAFENRGANVVEVDTMRSAHPLQAKLNEASFELTTKYTPYIYGLSYIWTRRFPTNSWLWRFLSMSARKSAERMVLDHSPDVVLQLFPEHTLNRLPSRLLRTTNGQSSHRPVFGVVLTDFGIHSRWFCPNMDVYYVPNQHLAREAHTLLGLADAKRVVPSGIPLRQQFSNPPNEMDAANQVLQPNGVGLPPSSSSDGHILVATGGRGLFGGLKRVLTTLYECRNGRNVVVMCGRNEAMRRVVEDLAQTRPGLSALPFVEQVAPWLSTAHYAVIKPGGVTVAECLATGCPMLFYQPPLGQELDNARFVRTYGAGEIADNLTTLRASAEWFAQPENAATAAQKALSLGNADAAQFVVEDILQRVNQQRRSTQ